MTKLAGIKTLLFYTSKVKWEDTESAIGVYGVYILTRLFYDALVGTL